MDDTACARIRAAGTPHPLSLSLSHTHTHSLTHTERDTQTDRHTHTACARIRAASQPAGRPLSSEYGTYQTDYGLGFQVKALKPFLKKPLDICFASHVASMDDTACARIRAAGRDPKPRDTKLSLIRKRTPLRPYRRPVPRVLGWSYGGGLFLTWPLTTLHPRRRNSPHSLSLSHTHTQHTHTHTHIYTHIYTHTARAFAPQEPLTQRPVFFSRGPFLETRFSP